MLLFFSIEMSAFPSLETSNTQSPRYFAARKFCASATYPTLTIGKDALSLENASKILRSSAAIFNSFHYHCPIIGLRTLANAS